MATKISWKNLFTVGSATTLIGGQLFGFGILTGWALAGLLGLGDLGAYLLEGAFSAAALVATAAFLRSALRVEPIVGKSEVDE